MKKFLAVPVLALFAFGMLAFSNAGSDVAEASELNAVPITMQDVADAQQAWGDGIVKIGNAFTNNEDYRAVAADHVREFYHYADGATVLFKPTLAAEDQFRGDFDEALSYFVGTEGTEDKGFAIAPYTNVRWENEGTIIDEDGDMAVAMGNYFLTGTNGQETKVEYSFGYARAAEGNLKITLHHSPLPFPAH